MARHRGNPTTISLLLTVIIVLQTFIVVDPSETVEAEAYGPLPMDHGENALLRFDFGTRGSPVMAGWTQVQGGLLYSRGAGYGWDVAHEDFQNFRPPPEVSPYVLPRSWVIQRYRDDVTVDGVRDAGPMTFSADLPNGDYRVKVILGDLFYPRYSMDMHAEGVQVASELAAFHLVFRTVYFKDARGNWANYGMPLPYWFDVSVGDGRLDITFSGNDSDFWRRMDAENATDPPNSYLALMSTGGVKAGAQNPPYRFIGGPHTVNSVLGLEVYPAKRDLVRREPSGLVLDASVTNTSVGEAVEDFNSASIQAEYDHLAESVREMLADHERGELSDLQALEELMAHMQGDLKADLVPDWLDERLEVIDALLAREPGAQTLWELRNQTERLRDALEFIFGRVETGRNHFYENCKAISVLWTFQPEDPLYPWARLWMARALYMLDPHRWTSASGTAADVMDALRPLDVDNPYIVMYRDTVPGGGRQWREGERIITTTGEVDRWSLAEVTEGWEAAPQWARWLREEMYWLWDITDWWVLNRQQPDGALGGGWSDDVEFIGLFGFDAIISQGADDLSLEGARRFVDGMLASGGVDMERGFSTALADAEHTAEWTGDSLPMMIAIDYGNPKWIEFSYKTGVLMRDLWMARTDMDHLHFRSNFLSATRIGGVETAEDAYINYRAALPAHWVGWYNGDPEIQGLFLDWATAWVEDAMRTDKGKPRGVFPASIGFSGDEVGGRNSPNWYTAQHPPGTVNYDWQPMQYRGYLEELIRGAYELTGNDSLLEPFKLEAQLAQAYRDDPVPSPTPGSAEWAGMILGQPAISRWEAMKVDYGLEGGASSGEPNGYTPEEVIGMVRSGRRYIDWCLPLMTSEASATDRVAFVGIINPFMIYTGGGVGGALLTPKVTYTGLGRDFAACVLDARPSGVEVLMYGFFPDSRDAGLVLWELENHGTYEAISGTDSDGDGKIDEEDDRVTFTYLTKGQEVPIKLVGGEEKLVVVRQLQKGDDSRALLPDLAVVGDEVTINGTSGALEVIVHNIGSNSSGEFALEVLEPEDENITLGSVQVPSLDPPIDLRPSLVQAPVHLNSIPRTGEVLVRVRTGINVTEITLVNNQAIASVNTSLLRVNGQPVYTGPGEPAPVEIEEDPLGHGDVTLMGLAGLFADPDPGDLLRYEVSVDAPQGVIVHVVLVNGTLVLTEMEANWSGTFTVAVTAYDSGLDGVPGTSDDLWAKSPAFTFVVLPINDPPDYIGPKVGEVHIEEEDRDLAGPVIVMDATELFRDVDGDVLRYRLDRKGGDWDNVTLEMTDGILTLSRLRKDWNGDVTFNISALDGGWDGIPGNADDAFATTPEHKLVVTPINDPPYVAVMLEPIVARFGGGAIPVDLAPVFLDVEGDMLYYMVDDSTDEWPSRISVQRDSADPTDPSFTVEVTDEAWSGRLQVTFVCYDRDPASSEEQPGVARAVLDITVEEAPAPNQPPSVPTINVVPADGEAGTEFTLTATGAVDPEGELLVYRWAMNGTPFSDWSPTNQVVIGKMPAGVLNITVTVRDPQGLTSTASVVLDVREPVEPDDGSPDESSAALSIIVGLVLMGIVVAVALYISRRPPS